ncbi:LysR family transcriptional regulator [Alicycliphilus denitrificans]|uniref:Transcriptional regulator, LysR family n=2 Tax=Alicycliphilus denitrificans TaxID=179636 RepID=F4GEH3_ALIDK|nr:LysR substrate-binding domain-containing protein [Alicycliphilus denitrificans]ADU98092.1 LysR substrate-binding protein [Alicycliphilus denitrificans BC]AEB82688.1 transcriptional regulator, LysR family [Alicycliphilus denitrificans K601]QKD42379.1 LysR family transcriptional regulator [Alicycliphilus denitrificans]GAO25990.1 LysR family transcriptional regulator [Alicycliphilus sp. B1]
MRYELTDLKVFLAIAAARSLSGGAADMHLTAPSASYRLKNLEQALGTALFERTSKGMQLTPAGLTVRRYAEAILGNVERLGAEMQRHTDGVVGHIRVFANSSTLNGLAPALSRFLAAYPNVNVELEEHLSATVVKAVQDDAADIGLAAGDIDFGGLTAIPYARDELVFVTPPGHPLAEFPIVPLDMALAHDLVGIGKKSSNFVFLEAMANKLGVAPRVRVHAPSFADVLACVKEGVGISLVPYSIAAAFIQSGQVQKVRVDEPWAQRQQCIVLKSPQSLLPHEQAFVSYVVKTNASALADAAAPAIRGS